MEFLLFSYKRLYTVLFGIWVSVTLFQSVSFCSVTCNLNMSGGPCMVRFPCVKGSPCMVRSSSGEGARFWEGYQVIKFEHVLVVVELDILLGQTDWQTHTTANITFLQLNWQAVIIDSRFFLRTLNAAQQQSSFFQNERDIRLIRWIRQIGRNHPYMN